MHPQYQQAPGQPGIPGPYPPQPGPPNPAGAPPFINSPQRPMMGTPGKPPGPPMHLGGMQQQQQPQPQPHYQNGVHSPSQPMMQGQNFPPRGAAPPPHMQSPLASQMSGLSMSGPQQSMPPAGSKQPPWSPVGAPPPQMGAPPGAQPSPARPGMPQQPYVNGSMGPGRMPPAMSSPGGPYPPQMGGPPSHMGGAPPQMGNAPPHMGAPPHMSAPPQMGAPPHMGGAPPQMGGAPQMGGGPPQMGGMPPQMGGMPPQMGAPQQPMGAPPMQGYPPQMGAPHPQMPPTMGGPPGPMMSGGYQQPGMLPPKPGFPPQPAPGGAYQPHPQQPPYQQQQPQQQQQKRLDPDQMPSPIQVMAEDQRSKAGVFYTGQSGGVPPLITTSFVTVDQGNSSPRFIRSSMYNIPATIDMMKQTSIPFGIVISPMAELAPEEHPPPIVDFGEMGPVRCIRCKAYMSPLMQFMDGGRRFHCLLCKATSDVPAEYFQHLDHTGQRVDKHDRPELSLGTYEMVATAEYCRNNTFPNPPAVIFLIDVSYNNIKSGMVNLLCREMKRIIRNLPKDVGQEKSNMRVGFITYSSAVNFYNIKGTLAQPKMLSVGDVNDMFMPLLDGFLCEPEESEEVIDSLMEQIPAMFAEMRETETILAPAIQAGLEALKASNCAGKLLVFHSSLPTAEAPGKLKNRDDRKLLGTEKEKTVLSPQTTHYNNLGQDCVSAGVSVDLFVLNNSYVDVATIGQVCRLTGGEVYKYTYFQADVDGPRLICDVTRNISRPVAFDAIMRVRTSTGVRPTDFYGHYYMSNTTDMELAAVDSDKAVAIEIKHDDKLTEEEGVFIQVALLYTSCSGQRRLRIINLALKTCVQMADLYRACDLDTVVNFLAKQSMFQLLDSTPKQIKDKLVLRCAQMLACYRKNCASPSSSGQLILPECMKLLPLYVNCLMKSDALSGGSDTTIDDRSYNMSVVLSMDIESSVAYFYPRLLPVHNLNLEDNALPQPVRCSSDKLTDDGAYLLENGLLMFLWVGANVAHEWTHSIFGDHLAAKIEIDPTSLPVLDNPLSRRLRQVIDLIRAQRHRSMKLVIVPQRDKLELVFKHFLVEDRGMDGSPSYVDFLCHMHKEIRNLLS